MIVGDENPRHILVNSPSRDYGEFPKNDGERELTPYGVVSVASYGRAALKAAGLDDGVGLIDAENFGLSFREVVENCATAEAGTIGLNLLTPNFVTTMKLADEIRRTYPNAQLVFGGPHATLDPESILRHFPDAMVVRGDGEIPFASIMLGREACGVVSNVSGEVVKGIPSVMDSLDRVPWIDRSLLANEPYSKAGQHVMTFLSSRGCVGSCTFCITPAQYDVMKEGGAKKIRFRELEDAVKEVASLGDQLDIAQFIDDDMLPSVKRVQEFLDLWKKYGLYGKKEFICLLRPDQIAKYGRLGLLEKLHEAGLKKISLGIETGHDKGRRVVSGKAGKIDPKYRSETQKEAIAYCKQAGITVKGFFMIGLPGETQEEVNDTIKYVFELGDLGLDYAAVFPVKVYPNTQLWREAIDLGFTPDELGHYDSPNVQSYIRKGVSAKDASRDGFTQTAQISEIPTEKLNIICQKVMAEFNIRKGR